MSAAAAARPDRPRRRKRAAYTLIEVTCVVAILAFFAATLAFVILRRAKPQQRARQVSCLSNLRQIGMALQMYRADFDDGLPPGAVRDTAHDGSPVLRSWAATRPEAAGLLQPYLKTPEIFRCPEAPGDADLTYLYNDLAALAAADRDIVSPARTILVADGEGVWENVGHAWEPDAPAVAARFNARGTCDADKGATLKDAPLRHDGGANYLMAEGHTRWLLPQKVWFPPRTSVSPEHTGADGKPVAPDPAGAMRFADRKYAATFHLR